MKKLSVNPPTLRRQSCYYSLLVNHLPFLSDISFSSSILYLPSKSDIPIDGRAFIGI